jgi:hypothetical protein
MKLRWMSLCAVVLFALPGCGMQAQETKPAERPAAAARGSIYRLTYTLTEMEGDRRIGLQHAVLNSGPGPGSLKIGSRVPAGNTYLDVGISISTNVIVEEFGVFLNSTVEQSSVVESDRSSTLPVIRQARLQNNVPVLLTGKSLVLGSFDVPGSTRHLEVSLLAERLQ